MAKQNFLTGKIDARLQVPFGQWRSFGAALMREGQECTNARLFQPVARAEHRVLDSALMERQAGVWFEHGG
jgi:hypothetical protein